MDKLPHARTENIVTQEMGREMLAYDLILNRAFHLNETSTLVWSFCDGRNSTAEIAQKMSAKLHQPITEDFVIVALDQFNKDNLLNNGKQIGIDFTVQSRRELIRRVGAASLVALPMIMSLVAPKSAMAQSGGAGAASLGNVCTTTPDCNPGLTCTTCAGAGCAGGSVCCSNNVAGAILPGQYAGGGCISDPADCNLYASILCCNGAATIVPDAACPTPGEGYCKCNP